MNAPLVSRFILAFALAAPASIAASSASDPTRDEQPAVAAPRDLSELLAPIIAKRNVPGMAGAIVRGDALEAVGATGLRAVGHEEKVTINDLWHIGSCTKAMTATMIAILIEDGTLAWETKLVDTFPELGDSAHESWKTVTLAQLLTNRSGTPGNVEPALWGAIWKSNETPPKLRLMLLDGMIKNPTAAAPGSKYVYSNQGFSFAGAMAERATGKTWESLMRERLFTPLGMTSADFGPVGVPGVISQPRGHGPAGDPREPTHDGDNPAAISPAGRVHCTIQDWAKYIALHLRADAGNPKREVKLLKAETFDTLHRTPKGADHVYASGWGTPERTWADGKVLTHNGSNTMWYCVTWVAPKKDFAVLVCCNQGGHEAEIACDEAAWAMIQNHLATQGEK